MFLGGYPPKKVEKLGIKWRGLVMRSRLELQTIHRKQSNRFSQSRRRPLLIGAFTVIMKTDCENRWIFCSTTINARLLSVCLVNGYWLCLVSEAYFLPSYKLSSFNHLTFNSLCQPRQQHWWLMCSLCRVFIIVSMWKLRNPTRKGAGQMRWMWSRI